MKSGLLSFCERQSAVKPRYNLNGGRQISEIYWWCWIGHFWIIVDNNSRIQSSDKTILLDKEAFDINVILILQMIYKNYNY